MFSPFLASSPSCLHYSLSYTLIKYHSILISAIRRTSRACIRDIGTETFCRYDISISYLPPRSRPNLATSISVSFGLSYRCATQRDDTTGMMARKRSQIISLLFTRLIFLQIFSFIPLQLSAALIKDFSP